MNILDLPQCIREGKTDEAIRLIEAFGSRREKAAVPVLIEIMDRADHPVLRNTAALALSDIGDPQAAEPIARQLKKPEAAPSRAALLYALEPFDYSAYFDLLVDLLCEGGFEVRLQCLRLIKAILKDIPDILKENSKARIRQKKEDLKVRADMLDAYMELL